MYKLKLLLLLTLGFTSVWASTTNVAESSVPENQAFQAFDNQYYIGIGASYGNSRNAYGQNANYGTTNVGFGVERLFDMGLWLRFDGSMMIGYSNFNSSNPNAITAPVGQDPSIANLDIKVGYAFPVLKDTLLVTPYALLGRNSNLSSNSLNNNMPNDGTNNITINASQDYFISGGVGGRIEYRINNIFDLYFDQNAVYNSDRSQPSPSYAPANNFSLTSTIGAKFNVWDELQLGANGYYSYYSANTSPTAMQLYQLVPQNEIGGMITIGLTY